MYLNTTSLLSATVCNSNLIGHCNQKLKNSSVYPIRKYIFLVPILLLMIPAILIILCWRFMITSLTNKLCQVPTMNFLMNMSSTAVSEARRPPSKFEVFHEFHDFLCAIWWGGFAISYVKGKSRLGVMR
jgi:hypothetical protein